MVTMGSKSSQHENDASSTSTRHRRLVRAGCRRIGHHPSVDTKTRLVVAFVFLLVVALIVIAGLIAFASPAK
jgi:hypothetical protein